MNNKKLFNYIDQYGGNTENINKINNLDNMLVFESSDIKDIDNDYKSSLLDNILDEIDDNLSNNSSDDNLSDISGGMRNFTAKIGSNLSKVGKSTKEFNKKLKNAKKNILQYQTTSNKTKNKSSSNCCCCCCDKHNNNGFGGGNNNTFDEIENDINLLEKEFNSFL
jgi:hypothetical protein